MKTTLIQIGNELGFLLPDEIVETLHLTADAEVDLQWDRATNTVDIHPVRPRDKDCEERPFPDV